jgi:hypothetical protein
MSASRLPSKIVGFCLTALALAACQAVAGIEDRTFDPDFGKPPASAQCKDYCATVMDACTGDDAQYTTEEICLGVCAKLDPGDDEDVGSNTVACRLFYANDAKREHDSCKAAGPGGDGVCGTDCEAYCQLFPTVCPTDYKYGSTKDCLKFCNALPTHNGLDVSTDHDGDSVECRLVHLSSATTKPEHCPHAQIPPSKPYCINLKSTDIPSCEDYCNIQLEACDGDLRQYESRDQCLAVCGALDPGTNVDESDNNVGCRRYHSFSATTLPVPHCYHSGPTGDGHCGHDKLDEGHTGNCDSYCQLVASACQTDFDNVWGSTEECLKECVDLAEAKAEAKYSLVNAENSTGLNCRVLYTARAFADPTACASALGNDQCE